MMIHLKSYNQIKSLKCMISKKKGSEKRNWPKKKVAHDRWIHGENEMKQSSKLDNVVLEKSQNF